MFDMTFNTRITSSSTETLDIIQNSLKGRHENSGMKISFIFVDIFFIYPISVMFDTISAMTDISPIYRFLTDI